MCGRGAGGGVARGRGGAGRAQVKDWGTPAGAIFCRWHSPRHSSLHHLQTQIPSTRDAVGFPTRGSRKNNSLRNNTTENQQTATERKLPHRPPLGTLNFFFGALCCVRASFHKSGLDKKIV